MKKVEYEKKTKKETVPRPFLMRLSNPTPTHQPTKVKSSSSKERLYTYEKLHININAS